MFALEYEFFASENVEHSSLENETRLRAVNHLMNILFYALIGLLIFLLTGRLLKSDKQLIWGLGIPFFTALIFTLHPVHIEVVANIKSRDELMMLFFSLSAMIYALRYFSIPSLKNAIITGVLFFLALLSKENGVTFLIIIPMLAYFFRNKNIKNSLKAGLPVFVSLMVYILLRLAIVGDITNSGDSYLSNTILINPFAGVGEWERYATIFYTLGKYLLLLIFPHPLTSDYNPMQIPIMDWNDVKAVFSFLVYLALLLYALKTIKKRDLLSFCILFYMGTLFITSNLVVNIGTFMNERFLFLPSFAFCLALCYLLIDRAQVIFNSRLYRITLFLFFIGLSLGFTYKNLDRIPDWKNSFTLGKSAVITSPNSITANQFYAYDLYLSGIKETDTGKKKAILDEANIYVNKALSMYPEYSQALTCKAGVVGELYRIDGDLARLLNEYYNIQLAGITPFVDEFLKYIEPRVEKQQLYNFYIRTGNALKQKGQIAKGEEYINKAITL
jgi:hypothetical protein